MPSWVKGYKPELICHWMEKGKTVSKDGAVSFDGFSSFEHVVLLDSMIELNKEVPEIEKRRIINKATFNEGAKGQITQGSLFDEIRRLERAYLAKPKQKFKMLTEISISRGCQFPKVNFGGSCIVVHAHLKKTSRLSRKKLMIDAKDFITCELPKDYAPVNVSVSARSISEAADKALYRLDFVRGIWNLWKNRSHSIRISTGKRSPVNEICLAPIQTLHYSNGALAAETWWWEPQYQGPIKLYNQSAKIENMFRYMETFRHY